MSNPDEFVIKNKVLRSYEGISEEVVIPEGVVEIGENAFDFCQKLESIVIPASVKKI